MAQELHTFIHINYDFQPGRSPGLVEQQAAERLGLPLYYSGDVELDGVVDNPLPRAQPETIRLADKLPAEPMTRIRLDPPIARLVSGQDWIRPSRVEYYRNGGLPKVMEHSETLPTIAYVNGELVVVNGNHRVLAVQLRGASTIATYYIGELAT